MIHGHIFGGIYFSATFVEKEKTVPMFDGSIFCATFGEEMEGYQKKVPFSRLLLLKASAT